MDDSHVRPDENAVRSDGVRLRLIHSLKHFRNEPAVSGRRYWTIDMNVDLQDALFIIDFLQKPEEDSTMITVLELYSACFSEESEDVFCNFLQTTNHLQALHLRNMRTQHVRRFLEAMHTNTSIKELEIFVYNMDDIYDMDDMPTLCGEDGGIWIGTLLRHKSDFVDLKFNFIHKCWTTSGKEVWAYALGVGLSCGQPYLRNLSFDNCELGDAAVGDICKALKNGDFKSLKEVNFGNNDISCKGIVAVSTLNMKSRLSIEKLWLYNNPDLFENAELTEFFAKRMLLFNPSLKELYIDYCSTQSLGYKIIIRALETNSTLMRLNMTDITVQSRQAVRGQLIKSIPKMKGLRYLYFDKELFDKDLMRAFSQSVSLVKAIGR